MADDRDSTDARLIASGDHATLLARWFPVIRDRCRLRAQSDDEADEAVQRVCERLLGELARGKEYAVPFRVVVHQVVDWVLGDVRRDAARQPTPDEHMDRRADARADGDLDAVAHRDLFQRVLRELTPREREVVLLRFVGGLDIADVAHRLGMRRNAVDQALHRARTRIRAIVGDA